MLGDYKLLGKLGNGSFGNVYQAISKNGSEVAIKVIPKSKFQSYEDYSAVTREISIMKSLSHPNIVKFFDSFQSNAEIYIVMEYCRGKNLYDFVIERERLQETESSIIFAQIVNAVNYLHSNNLIHRDLKLSNIIIEDNMHIKLIDFGLCDFYDKNKPLTTFCGSPSYNPPESYTREPFDGKKADMWSLGVILYELVTGQHPWNIFNTQEIESQIKTASYPVPLYLSVFVIDLISRLLQIPPVNRLDPPQVLNHTWITSRIEQIPYIEKASQCLPPLIRRSISLDNSNLATVDPDLQPYDVKHHRRRLKTLTYSESSKLALLKKSISIPSPLHAML